MIKVEFHPETGNDWRQTSSIDGLKRVDIKSAIITQAPFILMVREWNKDAFWVKVNKDGSIESLLPHTCNRSKKTGRRDFTPLTAIRANRFVRPAEGEKLMFWLPGGQLVVLNDPDGRLPK